MSCANRSNATILPTRILDNADMHIQMYVGSVAPVEVVEVAALLQIHNYIH